MNDTMTTAELIETAREKARAAMDLLDEARQIIGSQPSDEPTDDDNAYADRLIAGTNKAYSELYFVTR